MGTTHARESLDHRRSPSPLLSSKFAFLPQSKNVLPADKLQEIFLSCIDSVLKVRSRAELQSQVGRSSSPDMKANKILNLNEDQKSEAILKFMSKTSVLQALFDLMF
jgi:hypothetical protein